MLEFLARVLFLLLLHNFLPTPLVVVWVFRLTFSPPPLSPPRFPSHHQLFVSIRYRKRHGWHGSLAVYVILFYNIMKAIVNGFLPERKNRRKHFDKSMKISCHFLLLPIENSNLYRQISQLTL